MVANPGDRAGKAKTAVDDLENNDEAGRHIRAFDVEFSCEHVKIGNIFGAPSEVLHISPPPASRSMLNFKRCIKISNRRLLSAIL
jgi:hypothetical protein